MPKTQTPSQFAVILAFGLVYLFWGSTYLAIDIAVQTIPPALMCGVRFSIAGVVMLAVCAATGRQIWYSAKQIALAAIVGILLLMGGNLTLSWAELSVPSGLAALIVAITPLMAKGRVHALRRSAAAASKPWLAPVFLLPCLILARREDAASVAPPTRIYTMF